MRIEQPFVNRLIPSYGPPTAGSGLEPAVAPNTPWRWWASEGGWVSDPVDVSWGAGATIPAFDAPTAGVLTLVLGTRGTNPPDIRASFRPFGFPATGINLDSSTPPIVVRPASAPFTTPSGAGSGTAYLIWSLGNETIYNPGPYTADNTDVLPAETRSVEDILGADFTVTQASYEWTEEVVGNPGDWAIDLNSYTGDMWGPRDETGWGGNPEFQLGGVLTAPDGTLHRLIVANDGTLSTEPA